MKNLISNYLPAKTAEEMVAQLNEQINVLKPFKINLTEDAKNGGRNMAEGREGYARLVSGIASANIESLARDQDPQELVDKLAYDAQLENIRQRLLSLMEVITETQLANGVDIMKLVDGFVGNLQNSRVRNGSLDIAMREVDEWNKRFGIRKDEDPKS